MAQWAAHNACNPAYTDTRIGTDVVKRTWNGCRASGDVILYTVEGGGHTWPGSITVPGLGYNTTTINASELIWQFFQSHPLRAS
jgi:polyhydroxybutyrate depolymerase